MKKFLLPLTLLAATGCVSTIGGPDTRRLIGFYTWGFEVSAFQECGSDESWWVGADAGLGQRHRELQTGQYQPIYVVIDGEVSVRGQFGHLGAYDRQIDVSRVVEARQVRQEDCG